MILMEQSKKEKFIRNIIVKKEKIKRDAMILWAKITKKEIDPNDIGTIQRHEDRTGGDEYYIASPYIEHTPDFRDVQTIMEDKEKDRYVYTGFMTGADNAIGIVELNIPLAELVANPYGNEIFFKVLSEENAMKVSNEYYRKIGVPEGPLKGHATCFGKPVFVLGTIKKETDRKFSYDKEISNDIEKKLKEDRETADKRDLMREEDCIEKKVGEDFVIAKEDCWIEPGKILQYSGINSEAMLWKYSPTTNPIKIENGKYYLQMGELRIGKHVVQKETDSGAIKVCNPYIFKDVAVWSKDENLTQYFISHKLDGLTPVVSEMFNSNCIEMLASECKKDGKNAIIAGGIIMDKFGSVQKAENIPQSVEEAINEFVNRDEQEEDKIIKFQR